MHIHSHEKVLRVLDFLCRNLLAGKQAKQLGYLVVSEIRDRDEFDVGDFIYNVLISFQQRETVRLRGIIA